MRIYSSGVQRAQGSPCRGIGSTGKCAPSPRGASWSVLRMSGARQCLVKLTWPPTTLMPASVILTRASATVRPRLLMVTGSAVASPSSTRPSSSGVNRATNHGSMRPCCPASASISSAKRLRWLIVWPMIQKVRSEVSTGRNLGADFLGKPPHRVNPRCPIVETSGPDLLANIRPSRMTSEESENTEQIAFAPFYNTKLKDSAAPLYLDAAATPPPRWPACGRR